MLAYGYGLDRSYPARLQPELIARYERVSACWHQWLELADLERELLQPVVAVAVAGLTALAPAGEERLNRPKKRKTGGVGGDSEMGIGQAHPKKVKVDLPDDIRQAMKRIADFYASIE